MYLCMYVCMYVCYVCVYVGSEAFLLQTLRAGGVGCISATANVNPAAIHEVSTYIPTYLHTAELA